MTSEVPEIVVTIEDPAPPIVVTIAEVGLVGPQGPAGSGGGGGGAVDSVNGETGVVVLSAADVGADPAGSAATAQSNAITAAASDATAKANAAQSAATTAAATDATTKANAATSTAAAALAAHEADATNVHGIANTALLETTAGAQAKVDAAVSALMGGAPSAALDTLVEIGNQLATDESAVTALTTTVAGKATTAALTAHTSDTANPHSVTKTQVGLGNVDNTSDANKPVSTAQAAADALKLAKASNLSDLADATTARTNLGLGTAAVLNSGTSSGDVPLLSTGGRLAIARVASGTPDGTKYVRDDGTLATPTATVNPDMGGPGFGLLSMTTQIPEGSGVQAAVSGRQYLTRIWLPASVITNVHCGVRSAGATFSNTNTLALFTAAGTKVAETASQATVWNTTGYKTAAWTTPYTPSAAGYFYIGWLNYSTSNVSLLAKTHDSTANVAAGLLTSSTRLAYINISAQTAWPASYTLSSETASNTVIWFGVS